MSCRVRLSSITARSRDVEVEKIMAIAAGPMKQVEISGENPLVVDRLREPLLRALGGRRASYCVRVESVDRVGEVLVSITGQKGRLPLLFAHDELEPGYVFAVVSDTIERFAF
jgi:hypothetical protein